MPNDDLRADLNAAFDAAEKEAAPEPTPAPEPVQAELPLETAPEPTPEGESPAAREARLRDEKGRFAPGKAPEPAPVQAAPAKPQTPPVQTPQEGVKAPQSWKPAIREKFAALPPEVQQEVLRREREVEQAYRETAEARQGYQRFRETIAPFEQMIRAEGADPMQFTANLMRSAMVLQSGSPGNKAGLMANLIKYYGVDVQQLADALDGQIPQQGQAQARQEPPRDPRVDQLLAQVEQARAQRQMSLQQEAERLISEIEGAEFFSDVKDAMADILEVAAKRGVAMTPREAYNRAVWADPHVAEVLQQRQAAQRAGNPSGSTQRAAAAASSVRGSPAVAAPATQSVSLRGDIEAAIDRLRDS